MDKKIEAALGRGGKQYQSKFYDPLVAASRREGYNSTKNMPMTNTDAEIGVPYRSKLDEGYLRDAGKLGILTSTADQESATAEGKEIGKTENKAQKPNFKKGGSISSASKRADGCTMRGKTKGRMY